MGKRLHVAKTYKVEYSSFQRFNYKTEEFRNLLGILDCPTYGMDEYDEGYGDNFEVEKKFYDKAIETLKAYDKQDEELREDIDQCIEALYGNGQAKEELRMEAISDLETYRKEAEPEGEYMFFSFF